MDPLRGTQRPLAVNGSDFCILGICTFRHGADIVNAEGQYIPVIDRVHDGVGVELVPKGLRGGAHGWIPVAPRVDRENGGARKAKEVVVFEALDDGLVHITELAPVALVEDDHHVLSVYGVIFVLADEDAQLLDGGDDDAGLWILQLAL